MESSAPPYDAPESESPKKLLWVAGEFLRSIGAAAAMAGHVMFPALRRRRTGWGSTAAERSMHLPGDDLVPSPRWAYTRGITINAPRSAVWPWIAQLGQERGGFYSYEHLENLVGCRIRNTDRIHPEWQDLRVGDGVRTHARMPPVPITFLEPGRALVLGGHPDARGVRAIWGFHLLDSANGATRLLERGRSGYPANSSLATRLGFGPTLVEPISYVMSRRMLRTIKELAEARKAA